MNEEKKTALKTDMNDRERDRFAKQLRDMSEAATKAANALDSRDDTEFVMGLMILSLMSGGMKEMITVAMTAIKKISDPVLDAAEIG